MEHNNVSTRKWLEIRGLAVVAITTGNKLGTVDDFYFDPQTNAIRALLVKTGLFGRRVILASAVNAIGQHAVTIQDENDLVEEKRDSQLSSLPLGQSLLEYRVMSEGGNLVGLVGNMVIETAPAELRIVDYELSGGLKERITRHFERVPAQRVISYGQHVMVIPDDLAQALS